MGSKVYYMDGRSESPQTSLVIKMLTVFEAAGLDELIKPGDMVAIKVHCGEWNNTAYLRPVYARALADKIKSLGGRPFVCDTTTLTYSPFSSRSTELDLLVTAERNGYTSAALGCPFIVADGFLGTSDYRVDLPEGYVLKEAYIAQAIAAADVLIALTHFKGHPLGVIGGAIKNLGIGAQSKRGKHNVHLGGHPHYSIGNAAVFHPENCKGKQDPDWQLLEDCCPYNLFKVTENSILWDREKCTSCLGCIGVMAPRGIFEFPGLNYEVTDAAIADACLGAIKAVGKDKVGFINMAIDVSPRCDCVNYADMPLTPHLGVFASKDPVAIDMACVDMARKSAGTPGSISEEMEVHHPGEKKFEMCSAIVHGLSEEAQINTGVIIGMGSREYELIEVPPDDPVKHRFPPDPRPSRQRFAEKFAKFSPFPYDRYDGKGFLREEWVDAERVKHGTNGHHNGHGQVTEEQVADVEEVRGDD